MDDNKTALSLCPIEFTIGIIGRKWNLPIICELSRNGTMRYNQLKRSLDGITNIVLTQALKNLNSWGIVLRTQYPEIPPRVEYSLTEKGQELFPALYSISEWGSSIMQESGVNFDCSNHCCLASSECSHTPDHENLQQLHTLWDAEYMRVYQDILAKDNFKNSDEIDKLKELFAYILEIVIADGVEASRLAIMSFMKNHHLSANIVDKSRPLYSIINTLVDQGQLHQTIRSDLPAVTITDTIISFSNGIIDSWDLSNGTFDIIEKNKPAIDWFFESLRHNP